jgi:hypothetical protein
MLVYMIFKGKWFILAIIAMFIVVMIDSSKKYILDKDMIKPNELVIYSTIGIGLFGLMHFFYDRNCRHPIEFNRNMRVLLIIFGILGYLFSITFIHSIKLSPDVTLVALIVSLSVIFIYLISSVFFDSSNGFNIEVFFGLLFVILGINIISKNF